MVGSIYRMFHPALVLSFSLIAFLSNSSSQKLQSEDGHQDLSSSRLGVPRKLQLSYFIQGMALLVGINVNWLNIYCYVGYLFM